MEEKRMLRAQSSASISPLEPHVPVGAALNLIPKGSCPRVKTAPQYRDKR